MGRIQLLEDQLINKIAAGEVVERPASVVKELVENSLDAGATRITVELAEGGRKRILISDNGSGMDQEDAVLALRRHATSKIRSQEDLFQLSSMGFRGEAIASIASVAKFTLMTCERGTSEGVRVVSEGGSEPTVTPWQSHGGTTVVVDDLFYNIPVRAKFLKTASTEYGYVLELMQSLALAWPNVDFTLIHNGKELLRAPAVVSDFSQEGHLWSEPVLQARFAQIFRQELEEPLVYASAEGAYGQMVALLSPPGIERATARDIYLFVNGRFVKDKSLRFAVLRGYHSHLLKGKYPVAVVFLKMDPGLVDVNVHPSKTEVRLQFASDVQGMMAMSIRDALRKAQWSSSPAVHESESPSQKPETMPSRAAARPASFFADDSQPKPMSAPRTAWFSQALGNSGSSSVSRDTPRSLFLDVPAPAAAQDAASPIPWDELHYLGAIADCYLMFSHGDRRSQQAKLLVIDQHAFHERILYERLSSNADLLRGSQALLVPEAFVFAPEQIEALKESEELLNANGFRVAFVGNDTVELRAVPSLLAKADAEAVLLAFINQADSDVPLDQNRGLGHEILSTMACHAAVRAGEALGENELRSLLNEAKTVDFYHNCPHGRRVFRWWDQAQIGRWFDR